MLCILGSAPGFNNLCICLLATIYMFSLWPAYKFWSVFLFLPCFVVCPCNESRLCTSFRLESNDFRYPNIRLYNVILFIRLGLINPKILFCPSLVLVAFGSSCSFDVFCFIVYRIGRIRVLFVFLISISLCIFIDMRKQLARKSIGPLLFDHFSF